MRLANVLRELKQKRSYIVSNNMKLLNNGETQAYQYNCNVIVGMTYCIDKISNMVKQK